MKLIIPYWTPHHNMLIFSYFYFCKESRIEFEIQIDSRISANGAILHINNKTLFFDYSDSLVFIDNPKKYSFYFKRSLHTLDKNQNVFPINLQVNYSYKALNFLIKLGLKELISKNNRTEVVRALDYYNMFTNSSHNAMDVRAFPKNVQDNHGRVIFQTRLWNPENHNDADEKERRFLQNEFRIRTCRIIKKNFENASVGLFSDNFAAKTAPDLLLDKSQTSKKEYFGLLRRSSIAVADDGLKDTPGWKLGEYLLFGKAVITTPLSTCIENFEEHKHYEKLASRNSFLEIPDKIECLLKDKKYLEMGNENLKWSAEYLHPHRYVQRVLSIVENRNNLLIK